MLLDESLDPAAAGLDAGALAAMSAHFDGYVADGRLPGWMVTITRAGRRAWTGTGGYASRASGVPVTEDTLWRIYSMTKPITALLVMGLVDDGVLGLDDEVGRWVAELTAATVFAGGTPEEPSVARARTPVTIRHLLSHTSGLTYGFTFRHPVDAIYRAKGHLFGTSGKGLAVSVADWCSSPLVFEPGTRFTYSVAFDVLGHVIGLVTGRGLDAVLRERILDPLGLSDTDWWCPPDKLDRLADLELAPLLASWDRRIGDEATRWPALLGAGAGLVSSAADFERVMALMLGRGELDGVRVVSSDGFDQMVSNQLPGGALLEDLALDSYGEAGYAGYGYGYGQYVVVDAARAAFPMSAGSYGWGGAASTHYWVDPARDLAVAFYTQLLPTGTYPVLSELGQRVYAALTD